MAIEIERRAKKNKDKRSQPKDKLKRKSRVKSMINILFDIR